MDRDGAGKPAGPRRPKSSKTSQPPPVQCEAGKSSEPCKLPMKNTNKFKTNVEALPAFSILLPPPDSFEEQQKEKNKFMRRNKPKGEDLNKLKQIVKDVRKNQTNAHEFIGLVSPSTGDNGMALRDVLTDEMSLFRTTTRKIYETMTEDITDVINNEQIQLKEYTMTRHSLLQEKMQRFVNELSELCPDFEIGRFYTEDGYLQELFPMAVLDVDPNEMEALLRQEAYHRYQWLKSEGGRLKQENTRLQKRLRDLKNSQKTELNNVSVKERAAEEKRKVLETAQEILEDRLEELSESEDKTLVESELAQAAPISLRPIPQQPRIPEKFRAMRAAPPKPAWSSQQAAEMDATAMSEAVHAEASRASIRARGSTNKAPVRSKLQKRVQPPPMQSRPANQTSPFHYSPVGSPEPASTFYKSPEACSTFRNPEPKSPFHYSPVKTPPPRQPPQRETSPFHFSPNRYSPGPSDQYDPSDDIPVMRVNSSRVVTEQTQRNPISPMGSINRISPIQQMNQRSPINQMNQRGRAQAPRDTWGGFY